jgi:phenylalanyl-tRNA synthetase alpha chain
MFKDIDNINKEVEKFQSNSSDELEQFRIAYLGKKGKVTLLFSAFKEVPVDQKKRIWETIKYIKNKLSREGKQFKIEIIF